MSEEKSSSPSGKMDDEKPVSGRGGAPEAGRVLGAGIARREEVESSGDQPEWGTRVISQELLLAGVIRDPASSQRSVI